MVTHYDLRKRRHSDERDGPRLFIQNLIGYDLDQLARVDDFRIFQTNGKSFLLAVTM